MVELVIAAVGSLFAGALGSAVGLVLGSLRLPAILFASTTPAAAAGTNIAVSAAAALTGAVTHARAGRVEWGIVAWMAPPSIVGAFLGGYFSHLVPARALLSVIALVLAWNGVDLLGSLRRPPSRPRPRTAALAAGGAIGLLGGAVGLILGTLRMPVLVRSVGLPPHRAVGTNLVVGFLLGAFGFLGHLAQLEVEWAVLAASLAGAIPGAWLGARVTGRLSERTLRRALGIVLLAVAGAIALEAAVRA